jgi:MbtH protein
MSYSDWNNRMTYKVLVNKKQLYSIWPADRENPLGWNDAGKIGSKEVCLTHIEEVWTDMRPTLLRQKMDEAETKIRRDGNIP